MQSTPNNLTDMQIERKADRLVRNSGIELLKIIAIFLVITFHVVQTLRSENRFISYNDYIVDVSVATTNIQTFILALLSYFGALGNTIFFVCSAWFLLRSSKHNKRKWFFMLFEIWIVSIAILIITIFIRHGDISGTLLIRSILPTTFSNNWYLTCYLLFYPIHPFLNSIIHTADKKHLFRISATLFLIYCCFNFINRAWFFPSRIILWVTIYFVMAYLQFYMKDFIDNTKYNLILLLFGFIGYIGIAITANVLGLHVSYLNDKTLHWATSCNPFLIAMSVALFNIMRKLTFKNKMINYISSLSLLIYIIHENILLRTYFRPAMWNYIYENYGYDNVLLWVFALVFVVFIFGIVSSIIYDRTLRPLIRKIGDKIYSALRTIYLKIEGMFLKVH